MEPASLSAYDMLFKDVDYHSTELKECFTEENSRIESVPVYKRLTVPKYGKNEYLIAICECFFKYVLAFLTCKEWKEYPEFPRGCWARCEVEKLESGQASFDFTDFKKANQFALSAIILRFNSLNERSEFVNKYENKIVANVNHKQEVGLSFTHCKVVVKCSLYCRKASLYPYYWDDLNRYVVKGDEIKIDIAEHVREKLHPRETD